MAIKTDGDKIVTSLILTKEQKRKLDEQASKLGIGVSALIRLAVAEWLEKQSA
jgi:hypothetical protein